jgi:hypothetical protein
MAGVVWRHVLLTMLHRNLLKSAAYPGDPGNSFEDHVLRRHIWTSLIPSTLPLSGDVDFAALAMRYELSGGFIKKLGSCWGEIRDAAHRLQTQVLHRPIGHSYIFFRHVTQLFPRCSLSSSFHPFQ